MNSQILNGGLPEAHLNYRKPTEPEKIQSIKKLQMRNRLSLADILLP